MRFACAPNCRWKRLPLNYCGWSSTGRWPRCPAGVINGCPEKKNHTMYDIFVYLFENCHRTDLSQDNELIAKKLSAAGFEDSDISEALSWIAGVLHAPHRHLAPLPTRTRATRTYAPKECAKLDTECRGLVMHLENI